MIKVDASYYDNGRVHRETFQIDDSSHIKIVYFPNGQKQFEKYFVANELHRAAGPALKYWGFNGNIIFEEFYMHGVLHRKDGPALIQYRNNAFFKCWYYLNGCGIQASSDQEFIKIVKLMAFK